MHFMGRCSKLFSSLVDAGGLDKCQEPHFFFFLRFYFLIYLRERESLCGSKHEEREGGPGLDVSMN